MRERESLKYQERSHNEWRKKNRSVFINKYTVRTISFAPTNHQVRTNAKINVCNYADGLEFHSALFALEDFQNDRE